MSSNTYAHLEKILTEAAEKLGEHFDSVQIIAVTSNQGSERCAASLTAGTGSYYERLGATREWVITQEEYSRESARINQRSESDEE